jgi:hypothetical protein
MRDSALEDTMAGNTKKIKGFSNNQRAGSSRRKVLVTMAGASLSAMATKGAEAQAGGLSPTQIANFDATWQAFNNMASIPQDQSPLEWLLDADVRVFRVSDDNAWESGRDNVIAKFYGLLVNGKPGPIFDPRAFGLPDFSNPNMAKGNRNKGNGALWIDTDGSPNDILSYTFKFKGNLLAVLHAR